jgi:putative two-component system response regulator
VPESILTKPGPLTSGEFEAIKKHPIYSRDILKPISLFQEALPFIYHHHEKWDGTGYPDGIAGEAIPDGARIIALCDAFDAMALDRPYRKGLSRSKIIQIIREEKGKHLDPNLVDLFLGHLSEIVEDPANEQQLVACPA